eukprot:m.606016 g.606016  ORF g.606016 m.606016 type:complete len:679 (-) comp58111_c0_seq4:2627-4663(-)
MGECGQAHGSAVMQAGVLVSLGAAPGWQQALCTLHPSCLHFDPPGPPPVSCADPAAQAIATAPFITLPFSIMLDVGVFDVVDVPADNDDLTEDEISEAAEEPPMSQALLICCPNDVVVRVRGCADGSCASCKADSRPPAVVPCDQRLPVPGSPLTPARITSLFAAIQYQKHALLAARGVKVKLDVSPKFSWLSETFLSKSTGPSLCKFFCGGKLCKSERFDLWKAAGNAIEGLYSNWVTENLLAMARPSDRIIKEHNLIRQFQAVGVVGVVNLQMLGEHQHCGDGLQKSGFSYTPELFMSQGISVFNFKWEDFGVPSLNSLLDMVKVLDSMLTVGGKIAVHCHSGLGRTGVLLAAYLIYSRQLTAAEAISFVRAHRRRAIQTRGQMQIVTNFAKHLEDNRPIYSGSMSYAEILRRQHVLLHGEEARQLKFLPKLVVVCCDRILELVQQTSALAPTSAAFPLHRVPSALDELVDAAQWSLVRQTKSASELFMYMCQWLWFLPEPLVSPLESSSLRKAVPHKMAALLSKELGVLLQYLAHFFGQLSKLRAHSSTIHCELCMRTVGLALAKESSPSALSEDIEQALLALMQAQLPAFPRRASMWTGASQASGLDAEPASGSPKSHQRGHPGQLAALSRSRSESPHRSQPATPKSPGTPSRMSMVYPVHITTREHGTRHSPT